MNNINNKADNSNTIRSPYLSFSKDYNQQSYDLIEEDSHFQLIVPKHVENKIRHTCSRIYDVEWSGILFYKTKGEIGNDDFKVTCVDFCVMDIGSQAFTNFKDSEDIITYRVEHPDLLQEGIYEGLIHSHNNMATFFSGTDCRTLEKEGESTCHFLSLIVNNVGEYTARITKDIIEESKGTTITKGKVTTYFNTFNGETVIEDKDRKTIDKQEYNNLEHSIHYYIADIIVEREDSSFKELDARLNSLKSAKNARSINKGAPYYSNSHSPYYGSKDYDYDSDYSSYYPYYSYDTIENTGSKEKDNWTWKNNKAEPTLASKGFEKEKDTEEDAKISTLLAQIVTGCLFVNNKINIDNWMKNLDSTYSKIFGDLQDKTVVETITDWATTNIFFIIDNIIGTDLEDESKEEYVDYLLSGVISKLEADVHVSKVKEILIKSIKGCSYDII